MNSGYLCHLNFTLSKFTFKNFLFLKIVSNTMMSPSIFPINYDRGYKWQWDDLFSRLPTQPFI